MSRHQFVTAIIITGWLLIFFGAATVAAAASKEEIAQARADIRKMANETLARLYKLQPSAKNAISKSATRKAGGLNLQ